MVSAAKGGYYPTLSLQGDIGTRYEDPAGTRGEWLAGVFVEFPIFEGGLRRAQVAAADSRQIQSIEKKRDRLNSLKIDLATAWQDMENARNGVIDTRQTVATNEEAYASAKALYRNGKAIGLDGVSTSVEGVREAVGFIRRQNSHHAGHLQRFARVDPGDSCVRHRAEHQAAEQHALGAKVLGIFRRAGDLCDKVIGRVVVADKLVACAEG